MKKIALFLGLLLIGTSLMGQSTFRRGVIVGDGGNAVTIDSVTTSNDTIYFYSGSTRLYMIGSGSTTTVGTPVDNQVGVWTGDGTIEGDANLTWDATQLTINGVVIKEDTIFLRSTDTDSYIAQNDDNQYTIGLGGNEMMTLYGDGDNVSVPVGFKTDSIYEHGTSGVYVEGFNFNQEVFTVGDAGISEAEFEILDGATLTTTQANYLSSATGTTGTASTNLVFSTSPTFTTQITIGDDVLTEGDAELLKTISGTDVQTQIDAKADIANESHTGNTSIANLTAAILSVGAAGNIVSLDSITKDGSSNIYFYDGADTLNPYVPISARSTDDPIITTDYQTFGLFGSGLGLVGDTALIDASYNGYGYFRMEEDSLEITKIITNLSTGDTVNYSVVYNDTLWASADCDTIVTIPAGEYETITTSFTTSTIPEDQYIWVEMDAVVVTRKPIKFRVELVGYIKRD